MIENVAELQFQSPDLHYCVQVLGLKSVLIHPSPAAVAEVCVPSDLQEDQVENFVLGESDQFPGFYLHKVVNAQWMIVVDASETDSGLGFDPDHEADALLTKMLEAMGLSLDKVCLLKCGKQDFVNAQGILSEIVALLNPQGILAMGEMASCIVMGEKVNLQQVHGQKLFFSKLPVRLTYSPHDLLKSPQLKKLAWSDMQQFMRDHELSGKSKGS